MVVQHNLQAMNSNRMLGITQGTLSGSAEKLSSGYKVNRAADDAAGLSISEKMRKQIRGLTRASANAEDGISAVQTAEGALAEVHDMLQRMNELAVQASNGTNSESDRQTIQDEVDQLLTEIDRVSETTKFNEIYLLKGNAEGTSSDIYVNAHDAGIKGKLVDNGGKTATFELEKALEDGDEITIAGEKYTIGDKAEKVSTDGYAKYNATSTTIGAAKLQAGDTITIDPDETSHISPVEDYVTKTMVDKIDTTALQNLVGTANAEFTITDENGHVTKYVTAAAAAGYDAATDTYTVATGDAAKTKAMIDEALKQGHKVTFTKVGNATPANAQEVEWDVVSKLEENEVGADVWFGKDVDTVAKTASWYNGNTAPTNLEDNIRSVNLAGKNTIFTTQSKVVSADDIAKAVGMLKAGDKLVIEDKLGGGTAKTITIADTTDAKEDRYTVEDALKLINVEDGDMDEIEFWLAEDTQNAGNPVNKNANKFLKSIGVTATVGATSVAANKVSVVGSPTKAEVSDDVITAKEAYRKVADALKQASSIGTDEGKEAEVKNNEDGSFTIEKGATTAKDALKFNLHVGSDADMTNKINVKIDTMDTKGLSIQKLDIVGKDSDGAKIDDGGMAATYAIDAISDAISKVSAQRSLLGAVQNRLDHTIKNLDNVVENTTAAESQIRDTDMATEMVTYSNANILAQAGQSMLAQANQSNQGVLSLLG